MFKKKPIYIAGIVLFTLLLILDLVAYFAVPDTGSNMPSFGSGSISGFPGGDFDLGDMGDFNFGGQFPGMSGDFDFGGQRPGGSTTASSGLLGTIRSAFWPILIICILGDGLCIVMLVRISRREDNGQETEEAPLTRRDHTNAWLAAVAAVLVIAVTVTGLPSADQGSFMEAETTIEEAQASLTDLIAVFSGSGTLQSSAATEMTLPSGVTLTAYHVQSGDTVQSGDVIAQVDKTSVLKTIYEVQALLQEMDAEIAQVSDDTLQDTITARAAGRVKAIYVAEGDSIAAAMYENGAVMLLSLGGSMTVVIESDADVSVGLTLMVTLSDGTQIEGKVQQVRSGKITVTTTDDGPTPDDTVTVSTEDGEALGSGTLSISSPLKVTGYYGTAGSIAVSVGDTVEIGDTLIRLENYEDTARYQQLLQQRESLTELMQQLTVLYHDGCIVATADGIISALQDGVPYSQLTSSVKSRSGTMTADYDQSGSGITIPDGSFGSQTTTQASYAVETATICAITPAESMTVDVSVDELDILSLSVGQSVTVTLDALPGQSFTGQLTTIDTNGTNDGGSTKYTVTVELPRTQQMLSGMNASIRIEVSCREAVLTVPAEAVYEDGNRTYVYTALDEKTGEPTNSVDVTTGSCDGSFIEILSGLTEGDAVYYSYAQSITYRFVR